MFAQHSVTLAYRSDRVAAALAAPSHPWSIGLDGDGRELLAKVGVRVGRLPIYKQVQLKLGALPSASPADRLMLPVSWEAVGGPPLFPSMEGTIHVQPEDARSTRLTLNACYDPPLGALGKLIDRALMHRVAQATIKDFVERVAGRLDAELAD
ncbi:MAG: hypothetical protein ABI401_11540 [Candidatus Dormibacter sp.]